MEDNHSVYKKINYFEQLNFLPIKCKGIESAAGKKKHNHRNLLSDNCSTDLGRKLCNCQRCSSIDWSDQSGFFSMVNCHPDHYTYRLVHFQKRTTVDQTKFEIPFLGGVNWNHLIQYVHLYFWTFYLSYQYGFNRYNVLTDICHFAGDCIFTRKIEPF